MINQRRKPFTVVKGAMTKPVVDRGESLFLKNQFERHSATDKVFQSLLLAQWFVAILIAQYISPKTWLGGEASVHMHVWTTLSIGGLLTIFPCLLVRFCAGAQSTRMVIAVSQMGWSALLIHLTGGRIETHFHIFGSLAFLSFYRDWKVLAIATLVVTADHFVRGIWWPQSVFGVITEDPFRWVEHAAWVVFEDIFLMISLVKGNSMARELCFRQAATESAHRQELELHAKALAETSCGVSISDANDPKLPFIYVNQAFETITGYSSDEVIGKECSFLDLEKHDQPELTILRQALEQHLDCAVLLKCQRKDGTTYWNKLSISPIRNETGELSHYLWVQNDVSERELAMSSLKEQAANLAVANARLETVIEQRLATEREKDELTKKLITASRQAGMNEIATGVLHNVGNVMNSVNASAEALFENLSTSRVEKLDKLVNLLNDPDEQVAKLLSKDEKGQQIQLYMEKLAMHLGDETRKNIDETELLRTNINHVAEIVSMQQTYAKMGGLSEEISLNELCEDAIKINDAGLVRHGVDLITDYKDLPLIMSEKHKVLQILVNFVSNAKYAVSSAQTPIKRMEIRTGVIDNEFLYVEVSDNGIGIAKEVQDKIFRHGFTTKSDGHGFGLHSSILGAREIGGDVLFESDGPNQGASFRLLLPIVIPGETAKPSNEPIENQNLATLRPSVATEKSVIFPHVGISDFSVEAKNNI